MQDRVFDLYVLSKDVVVPFFAEAGERNLHRHVEDDRRQLAVVEQYVRSIMSRAMWSAREVPLGWWITLALPVAPMAGCLMPP